MTNATGFGASPIVLAGAIAVGITAVGCERRQVSADSAAAQASASAAASSDPAVAVPPPPLEPETFSADQPSGLTIPVKSESCNLDIVAGAPASDVATLNRNTNTPSLFVGWAVDGDTGKVPPVVVLELVAGQSHYYVPATRITQRPDVAERFKQPSYLHSGFDVLASLATVEPGEYTVNVLQVTRSGQAISCDPKRRIKIL